MIALPSIKQCEGDIDCLLFAGNHYFFSYPFKDYKDYKKAAEYFEKACKIELKKDVYGSGRDDLWRM